MDNKIKIIADSTSDLEKEYLIENGIEIVPLGINFSEKHFEDGINLNTKELYEYVASHKELPKTSAPSIETFRNSFKKWIDEGYEILCITISSDFSSCYQNACIASEEFEDKISCIDSRNLSSGIGLIIVKAVKYIKEGKSLLEITELLKEKIIPNVRCQFVVETLDYLYKGGRCSSVSYIFGKHLHIHPIILVKDGKMIVYKKPRGKMINGLNTLLDIFKEDYPNIDEDCVMITHSLAPNSKDYLYGELTKIIPSSQIMITNAGCVVSSHCGQGTIGILYIKKD